MLTSLLILASLVGDIGDSSPYRVIVNIPERVLRVYSVPGPIDDLTPAQYQFPIAVGLRAYPTPVMTTYISGRARRPAWHAPRKSWAGEHAGRTVPFDSSANPFRARNSRGGVEGYFVSLQADDLSDGIGFHSTSHSRSIGKLASHGCIRMKLEDVRKLFNELPDGTPVEIAYDIFRAERDSQGGFAVRAFQDIYRRLTDEQKATALLERKRQHGIPLSAPVIGQVDPGVLEERTLQLPRLDRPIVPVATAQISRVPADSNRVQAVEIRNVPPVSGDFSRAVVIVNFP